VSGGHDSRGGLPATPREIQAVLRIVSRISAILTGDAEPDPAEADMARQHGELLAGLVAGFEGTVYPAPSSEGGKTGYRVAQSLAKGGTPWV